MAKEKDWRVAAANVVEVLAMMESVTKQDIVFGFVISAYKRPRSRDFTVADCVDARCWPAAGVVYLFSGGVVIVFGVAMSE